MINNSSSTIVEQEGQKFEKEIYQIKSVPITKIYKYISTMDVMNSSKSDAVHRKKHKRINTKIKQFSIEIYFMWFSALIFFAETFVGKFQASSISNINIYDSPI